MFRQTSDVSSAREGASSLQASPEPAAQSLSSGLLPSLSAPTELNVTVGALVEPLDVHCKFESPTFSCSGSFGPEDRAMLLDLLGGSEDRMPLRLSKIMEERLSAGLHGMDLDLPYTATAPASPKCEASSTDTASLDQDSGLCVTQGALATGSQGNAPETVQSAPAALQRGCPVPNRDLSPGKRKVSWEDEHKSEGEPWQHGLTAAELQQLSPADRRRLRRRVTNKASAQRVRQKRLEALEAAEAKARACDQQNQMLQHYVRQLDAQRTQLSSQVQDWQQRFHAVAESNVKLTRALMDLQSRCRQQMPKQVPQQEQQTQTPTAMQQSFQHAQLSFLHAQQCGLQPAQNRQTAWMQTTAACRVPPLAMQAASRGNSVPSSARSSASHFLPSPRATLPRRTSSDPCNLLPVHMGDFFTASTADMTAVPIAAASRQTARLQPLHASSGIPEQSELVTGCEPDVARLEAGLTEFIGSLPPISSGLSPVSHAQQPQQQLNASAASALAAEPFTQELNEALCMIFNERDFQSGRPTLDRSGCTSSLEQIYRKQLPFALKLQAPKTEEMFEMQSHCLPEVSVHPPGFSGDWSAPF